MLKNFIIRKYYCRKTRHMIKTFVLKKMHSRFLVFVWRKKLLLLATSLAFLVAILWGFVYSSHFSHSDSKRLSIKELMVGNKYGLLQKLGMNRKDANSENEPILLKPTAINLQTLYALNRREKYFKDWNKILLDKDEKDRIDNFAIISRDDIVRRKIADEMKLSANKQAEYEGYLKKMGIPVIVGLGPTNRHHTPPDERIVHFDLKGAPMKVSYILKILPMLKTLGATGILIEYEDTFPYSDILSPITAKNAYSRRNIIEILQAAHSLDLKVIPLVQTFGHMEFALKLKEFVHLREVPESPQSICPSLNSSFTLIETLLTQVIQLHTLSQQQQKILMTRKGRDDENGKDIPELTHIHIGCDEVYQLGECPRCREKVHDMLFLDHVYSVAAFIKKKWPKLNVIVWDDQMRQISTETLRASSVGNMVEPMIWSYSEDVYKFIQSTTWDKYSQIFKSCWVAGAFKGAFGETLLIPPGRRHLENTLRWLAIIQGEGTRFQHGIKGIVLTGWSRYDHFATLCELFPAAIPSLAMSLHTASKGYFDIDSRTNSIIPSLTCPDPPGDRHIWLDLQKDPNLGAYSRCLFPGSSIFRLINRLSALSSEARQFIDSIKFSRGWLSDYNIRHNFSSSSRIIELLDDQPRLLASLINLARNLSEQMEEMFDHFTIGEYIEQRIYPLVNELRNLEKIGESLKMKKIFPVRPLPYLEKFMKELGITQKTTSL
ncbi:hypothetical protein ACKWTF_007961 [Chironomus riparius]